MKVLVLSEDYPTNTNQAMMFVHVRNKYYAKNDINVTVLNFRAKCDYEYEGIKVITIKTYKTSDEDYDILVCHAANLKHHFRFLNKYQKKFDKIVFFYHGHEILKINEVYPKKYKWKRKSFIDRLVQNLYDTIKCKLWHKKISRIIHKSQLVFVSKWLYYRFLYYIHINPAKLEGHISIINNSVGSIFEEKSYDYNIEKEYDFITIRGGTLDGSKYGIDIVTELAKSNPKFKFLVIGKGDFYKYNVKPDNIIFIEKSLTHDEMISFLNKSRCALLPTKQDTQGVLTCEMATFGIPTITSDIEICKEMFDGIDNVKFINNNNTNIDLGKVLQELETEKNYSKTCKFYSENTINKEIEIFNS